MKILKILGLLLLVLAIACAINYNKIWRLNAVNHLFDEDRIVQNFQNMDSIFNVSVVPKSTKSTSLPQLPGYALPQTFNYEGNQFAIADFLEESRTEGLLIIHNDTVILEQYANDLQPDESHISWSMAKSFTSAITGILVDQGKLDIYKHVEEYLPEFKGTGYEGVRVKDLLQMSSGVGFNEDYSDFNSDINRFGRAFAMGSSLKDFAQSLHNSRPPGTYNHYVSIDSQVLGLIISQVSGKTFTELLYEMIWEPLGMEYQAEWLVDNTGFEVVLGGLNATLRDFAKLGLLYLHEGNWNGRQLISKAWVNASITPDAPHLLPNQSELSSNLKGYGYQWWIPRIPKDDFMAVGIYDQYIYINKAKNLVITKLSADHNFKTNKFEIQAKHVAMFQDIAETF